MAVVTVEVAEDGLRLSSDTIRELGLQPGQKARVEIRYLPDAQAIRHAAMRYAWRKLGDAVGIAEPVWDGEVWKAGLWVRGREGVFGELCLTEAGEVVIERSTSKQQLHEALHAASAHSPSAE